MLGKEGGKKGLIASCFTCLAFTIMMARRYI